MPATETALESFARGYITCALWSSVDDKMTPLDEQEYELAPEARETMASDCAAFMESHADDLREYAERIFVTDGDSPYAWAGHDLWLTRNGHGAGFWDRGLRELGEALTLAASALGEVALYVGDDGLVYIA